MGNCFMSKRKTQRDKTEDKNPKDSNITVAFIAAGATIMVALIGVLSLWIQNQPTATSTISETATIVSSLVVPTATPLLSAIPPVGQSIDTPFNQGETVTLKWPTVDQQDSNVTSKGFLVDNIFIWDLSVTQAIATGIFADMPTVSDFAFQTDIKKITGPDDAYFGISFRHGGSGTYDFYIQDVNKKFLLRMWNTKQYEYIINWQRTEVINQNDSNTLKVIAQGPKIQLYINDVLVGDVRHNGLTSGNIGISAALYDGESATFEISKYELILH